MDEKFLSYLWFNKLFDPEQMTLMGEKVEIVSVGQLNTDAGPDAFNAKVRIDGRLWAGSVEFHVRASDWHRHNHDGRENYDRIILHVVLDADEQIVSSTDQIIPTIQLSYPAFMLDNYRRLMGQATTPDDNSGKADETRSGITASATSAIDGSTQIARSTCHLSMTTVEPVVLHSWMDRMLTERLEEKIAVIENVLQHTGHDWESAFYIMLCRAMGFGTNSDAMQSLAQSIPLSAISHHRDNLEQIEAMMLGQAGFLDNILPFSPTEEVWMREYAFLQNKFSLSRQNIVPFKMLRMRPPGFPTMRIAQTAAILHRHDHLLRHVLECQNIKALRQIFSHPTSDYWLHHYSLGRETAPHSSALSASSIDIIIINTVVPFLFLYGRTTSDYDLQERATDMLRQLPAEHNSLTDSYKSAGIECNNAYDSQALLRLNRHYCSRHECLRCVFGATAINNTRG